MIPKSVKRFSEKIMLHEQAMPTRGPVWFGIAARAGGNEKA